MRYFHILLLLPALFAVAHAERPPVKSVDAERPFNTEGKTRHEGSPSVRLMLESSCVSFTDEVPETGLRLKTAPEKIVSASGTDMQGFLKASSSPDYPPGWYDINVGGEVTQLFGNTAMMGSCGYVRDGRICQFSTISSYGYYWFYYSEYSLETGEQLYETELPDSDMRNYVVNCAYDEKSDMVYMQTYAKNFSGMAWSAFNPETRERTYLNNNLSWDDNRVIAIGVNPRDSRIYGVRGNGDFVELDRISGKASVVGPVGFSPAEYSQSMTYAPMEHGFVWAGMLSDNTSGFYRIDPATGSAESLGMMAAQNQFLMLWCPDSDASDSAPDMPDVSAGFDGPSLTGNLKVSFPSCTFGGKPLPHDVMLEAEIVIDGTQTVVLKGMPGSEVSSQLTLTQGERNITARCRAEGSGEWGPQRKSSIYVGYDTPLPPQDVRIAGNRISWAAPAGSVHGGYMDASAMTYSVSLNDLPITAGPVADKSVTFTPPSSLGIYHARVVAHCGGMSSEAGVSKGVRYGEYLGFPFSFVPTAQEFGLFTVVDGNRDGNSWKYFDGKDCVYYNSGSSRQADEWLLMPLADFNDTEHLYRFTFDAKSLLLSRPEDFELCLLKDSENVADVYKVIGSWPAYGNDQWTQETLKFNVAEQGRYHIGFHCTTPEGFQLMLRSFACEKTYDTMKAPAECKGVTLTAAGDGKLEGRAEFFAPTKALDGTTLDSGKEITVYARTEAGEGMVKVMPGTTGEVVFPCVQGDNRVTIVTANDGGEGMEKIYHLFSGQEKPGQIENLKTTVSEDNLSMTISWDAPSEGESGGYINPEEVGYYIYTVSGDELAFLEDIGTTRTYTLSVDPGPQALTQLAVGTYNVAGAASSASFRGTSAILGSPLKIPAEETFAWGIPSLLPNVIKRPNANYTVQWGHGDPTAIVYDAITPDYGCMYAQPSVPGHTLGRVEIPRVSTSGYNNVSFRMNAYRFPQGGIIRILGRANDSDTFEEIGELDCSKGAKGYVETVFKLPQPLQNRPWVAIAIEAEFDCESTTAYVILDGYSLLDLPDNDLALTALSGPDRLKAGESGEYTAVVENIGKNTMASSVLWEVTGPDGETICTDTRVVSPLDPGETEESVFAFTADGRMSGSMFAVRATVVSDKDDTPANDSRGANVALISAGAGRITDLHATVEPEGVCLLWSAPQMKPSVNEDFCGIESGSWSAELGVWKNIDRDGKEVCSIRGVELPDAGTPKAWQVIDESLHALFNAHKGSRFLLAMTPADESAANDWLVSPEVEGGSEIVLAADILTSGFEEEFEILVSDSDDDPASFIVLDAFSKNEPGWETYMVRLPREARHFAIRYCSVDQFGLMLDDIDYVPAGGEASVVTGYNVYRDGVLLDRCNSVGYTDASPLPEATYNVVPLVRTEAGEAEAAGSDPVFVSLSGVWMPSDSGRIYAMPGWIVAEGYDNCTLIVTGLDGTTVGEVRSDGHRAEVHVAPGVYVATCGDTRIKVIVR